MTTTTVFIDDFSSYADKAEMLAAGWIEHENTQLELSSGRLRVNTTLTNTTAAGSKGFPTTNGKTYMFSIDCFHNGQNGRICVGNVAGSATLFPQTVFTTSKNLTGVFTASGGTSYLTLQCYTSGSGFVEFDNINIVEIPGIHASQATTANKPILRRGLVNQLLYSQDFSNATYAKAGASIVPSATTYSNGDSAALFQETAGGTFHELAQGALSFTDGISVTLAFIAKKATSTAFQIFLPGVVKFGAFANFNLNAGAVGSIGVGAAASIADLGGGWYLGSMNVTPSATITNAAYACLTNSDPNSAIDPSYLGTLGNGVYLYRAGLFQGTYTAQQILDAGGIPLTTTAAASNSSAGKYSWQFDGVNDSLSLSAPLFQMSDDHCVIAGSKVDNASAQYTVFSEFGTGRIQIRYNTGAMQFLWLGSSVGTNYATTPTYLNQAIVVAGRNVSGTKTSRVNGVTLNTDSTVPDTPSMTQAHIGSLGGASNFMSGSIYPVIAIKGTVSDADLLTLERFVGQLSGVSI